MPQYYFDLYDEDGIQPDDEGLDLPDLDTAARKAAYAALAAAWEESRLIVRVEVRNAAGPQIAATVALKMDKLPGGARSN